MKNRLLNSFFRAAAAFALLLSAGACKDDVALPMQSITLSSHAILAPSFATTLSFDVAANCEWQIFVTGNDDGWAELSQVSATGTATVSVMVDENTTAQSRSLTIRAVAKRNADVTDELHTDLHECLGHGSGKLLPGVDPDALKAYGSTIEEARADLFGHWLPTATIR